MVDLTKDEMDDLLLAHEKAELEYDVEATMATLVANPHFEFPTLGFAIDGWDGVRPQSVWGKHPVDGNRP